MGIYIGENNIVDILNQGVSQNVYVGDTRVWPISTDVKPLTFNILSDGVIKWKSSNANIVKTIYYKKNGSSLTEITSTTSGAEISVQEGDKVEFFGDNDTYGDVYSGTQIWVSFTGTTCDFNIEGHLGSLLKSTLYDSVELSQPYALFHLFDSTPVIDAYDLVFPNNTTDYCYPRMFNACTSLERAPQILPAKEMHDTCYSHMFDGCTSLISAPVISGEILANQCYLSMFEKCESLETPPELAVTTLARACYRAMFKDCYSLETAPELLATDSYEQCYYEMFYNCTNIDNIKCLLMNNAGSDTTGWLYNVAENGTFTASYNGKEWISGKDGIPVGWAVIHVGN